MARPRGSYEADSIAYHVRLCLEANAHRSWSADDLVALFPDLDRVPASADVKNAINSALINWLRRGVIVRVERGRYRAHPDNPNADWFD